MLVAPTRSVEGEGAIEMAQGGEDKAAQKEDEEDGGEGGRCEEE